MSYSLPDEHKNIAKRLKQYKAVNKSEQLENYFVLEDSVQTFIYKADVTATSKLLLIYLLSRLNYSHEHLYIHAPYERIFQESDIKRAVAMKSLKDLEEKGFLQRLSGKKRAKNTAIKAFIFKQIQSYNFMFSQTNIIDMTPFFAKFFKAQK